MALTLALSLTVTNCTVTLPAPSAVTGNAPPAPGSAPRRLEHVEVGQHLRAVDLDVEQPLPAAVPVDLGEVQPQRVGRPRRQAGQGVGEVAVALGLVDGRGGGLATPAVVTVAAVA